MYDLRNERIKRRVVIYARVSTEHEAQLYALDNQIDWYKSILNDHPEWTLVEQYIDEGITGTSAKKRPKFMKMISDAMTDHEDQEAGLIKGFNPFDWKTGANFVFEGVQVGKFTKNDSSHFGSQKPINKWNGKSYVELTDEEIDEVESKLYTLADCEHKEEDVKNYQEILDAYLAKNGAPLFEGQVQNVPVAAPVTSKSVDDEPSFTPNSAASTDEEITDTDDFFSKLANG